MPIRIRLIAKRTSRVDAQLGSTTFLDLVWICVYDAL